MTLEVVTSLDAIAEDPRRAEALSSAELRRLGAQARLVAAAVEVVVATRPVLEAAVAPAPPPPALPAPEAEALLTVHEAAEWLRVSPLTLQRRARQPGPYRELRVDTGMRMLRFSASRIREAIRSGRLAPRAPRTPRIGRAFLGNGHEKK